MTDDNGDYEALSPDDDAAVTALLAALPELSMPADVAERIATSLAAEAPLSGPVPAWAAGGSDNVTVLPSNHERERRGARGASWLTGIAASVLVLVGLVVVGTHLFPGGNGSGGTTAGADTANVPTNEASAGTTGASLLTTSGTHYTAASLDSEVSDLVTQASTPGAALTTLSTVAPTPSSQATSPPPQISTFTESKALVANLLGIQVCLRKLDRPEELPIAADAGSWDGKPAVVIVYHGDQAARVDVYVVEPACGDAADADEHMLYFGAVPAP